jgi:hypothetical protein
MQRKAIAVKHLLPLAQTVYQMHQINVYQYGISKTVVEIFSPQSWYATNATKSNCVKVSPSFSPISVSHAPKKGLPIRDLSDGCSQWLQNTQNIPLISIVFIKVYLKLFSVQRKKICAVAFRNVVFSVLTISSFENGSTMLRSNQLYPYSEINY